jgi:hypothetical protein
MCCAAASLPLASTHPTCPLPQGFFGCKHFSQANAFLQQSDMPPIDWQIDSISAEAKAAAQQQHQAALAAAGVAK